MRERLRSHLPVLITAVVVGTLAAGGPALAAAAYDALNADKVDGKHAVGSGASIENRKGKLVATSPTTGRLPNNIIAKAPDAELLDGKDSAAFLAALAKATDSDKLDGIDSAGFLGALAKAVDSDKLDGLDSTHLQRRVSGVCPAGTSITGIAADGTPTCSGQFLSASGKAADSSELDGRTLGRVRPVQATVTDTTGLALSTTPTTITSLTIDVPAAGRIEVSGTAGAWVNKPSAVASSHVRVGLDDAEGTLPYPEADWTLTTGAPSGYWSTALPVTKSFDVATPGSYTYHLIGIGSPGANAGAVTLNAHFFPTG